MKKLLLVCALFSYGFASMAQCNTTVTYISDKVHFVDSLRNTDDTQDSKISVMLTKTEFVMIHDDDEDDALRGTIKNLVCDWKVPYKNGKTIFESELTEKSGETKDAVISIAGNNDSLLIEVRFKAKGLTLKIVPLSYTEGK